MSPGIADSSHILIDAHAHLHSGDVGAVLDAASGNFERAANRLGVDASAGCLLLAEPADRDRFERLRHEPAGSWGLAATDEPTAIRAMRRGRMPVHVFAGRQITVRERLEVHALLTRATFPDGESLLVTISMARDAGAIVVIPWGVGKWLGRRGRAVRGALERNPDVLVSDNGGRPWPWPLEGVFRAAAREGRPVLAGTDPLPLGDDWTRLGSFGVVCRGTLDADRPADSVRRALASGSGLQRYGTRRGIAAALRDQARMRLRGRRRR